MAQMVVPVELRNQNRSESLVGADGGGDGAESCTG